MIYQSKKYADNCLWFTSLVSKESNLKAIYKALKNVEAKDVRTLAMGQGNKVSRIVAWTFFE
jgi:23S rRNA (adenine1618-N6)-methyltransferase